VHGLGGHPRDTWEDDRGLVEKTTATASKRKRLFSRFGSKSSTPNFDPPANAINDSSPSRSKVFWPEEFLAPDISEARVWTYGYNADAIKGLFEANSKNSISQHGRDLAVQIERDIENEVVMISHVVAWQRADKADGDTRTLSCSWHTAWEELSSKMLVSRKGVAIRC